MVAYIVGGAGLIAMMVIALRTSHPLWGTVLSLLTGVLISVVMRWWGIFP